MLQVLFSFIEDETDDGCRNKREANRNNEYDEYTVSTCLSLLKSESNRERLSRYSEFEIGVVSCSFKYGFIHEVREEGTHILRGNVNERCYLVLLVCLVSLKDVV